jgi:hypothetical protein
MSIAARIINTVNDTAPAPRGIGLWDKHGRVDDAIAGVVTLEAHLDGLAQINRIGVTINNIGGNP